jgi:hypothetical protein
MGAAGGGWRASCWVLKEQAALVFSGCQAWPAVADGLPVWGCGVTVWGCGLVVG